MRLYNRDNVIPRYIYSKYTDGSYDDEGIRELERNLPYLNAETGLKNRMVLRDPLTGLGLRSDELDPLSGSQLPRRPPVRRDLIGMDADRGQEFNCLYTTKELRCKPREDRDPITLKGNLGEELDQFRPEGGRPRNHRLNTPWRDPIVGIGEFGDQGTTGHHYNGRSRSSHIDMTRTDPITHRFPECTAQPRYGLRQFKERWISRNPILHTNEKTEKSQEMRHFPQRNRSFDPITHLPLPYVSTGASRASGENVNGAKAITRKLQYTGMDNTNQHFRRHHGKGAGMYNSQRIHRNPITGEGMKPDDYSDTMKLSRQRSFRNRETCLGISFPLKINQEQKPVIQPSTGTHKTAKPIKRTSEGRTEKKVTPTVPKDTTMDKSVEKKVVRPKRAQTESIEQAQNEDTLQPTTTTTANGMNGQIENTTITESVFDETQIQEKTNSYSVNVTEVNEEFKVEDSNHAEVKNEHFNENRTNGVVENHKNEKVELEPDDKPSEHHSPDEAMSRVERFGSETNEVEGHEIYGLNMSHENEVFESELNMTSVKHDEGTHQNDEVFERESSF